MQYSWKFNCRQEPRVRNIILVLRCEETGGQRETCSLPVPRLPPCSRDRPAGALLPVNLETKLRAVEVLKNTLSHQISHQYSLWDMAPTPNSPDRSLSLQSFPVPATVRGRSGGLAVVPPLHCHTQSWQQEPCVPFSAVSWILLTPVLQILMILLPKLSWRQSTSP